MDLCWPQWTWDGEDLDVSTGIGEVDPWRKLGVDRASGMFSEQSSESEQHRQAEDEACQRRMVGR